MTESESVALPFGDSPIFCFPLRHSSTAICIIIHDLPFRQALFLLFSGFFMIFPNIDITLKVPDSRCRALLSFRFFDSKEYGPNYGQSEIITAFVRQSLHQEVRGSCFNSIRRAYSLIDPHPAQKGRRFPAFQSSKRRPSHISLFLWLRDRNFLRNRALVGPAVHLFFKFLFRLLHQFRIVHQLHGGGSHDLRTEEHSLHADAHTGTVRP